MNPEQKDTSLETLQEIRSIMERSARLLSLSGWSGIWAGAIALISSAIAHNFLPISTLTTEASYYPTSDAVRAFPEHTLEVIVLALLTFIIALIGGVYFTYRKNKKSGVDVWNHASKRMLINLFMPLTAGAFFTLSFILNGDWAYIAPGCLIFYGLALINGSKYTISDIKYLGLTEVILGCMGLWLSPGFGLYLWALGFGVLHILYGIIMWRKYDRA